MSNDAPGKSVAGVSWVVGVTLLLAFSVCAAGAAPKVLFIRGADRSGGFLEAKSDADRTEQLADINNASTAKGNHGWKQLADALRGSGFEVSQITETVEPDQTRGPSQGIPVALESMDLSQYRVIVLGSNNATYGQKAVDAIETYIRNGGGAIFISDANFGSSWRDASNSDQPFLDRLGLVANQDNGQYALYRSDNQLLDPEHPIFRDVGGFDGEGVTPATVLPKLPDGVSVKILARAQGQVRRNKDPFGKNSKGPTTPAEANDAALVVGTLGKGRFAYHFDRNTFFNDNGADTWLEREVRGKELDNRQFAINLFQWTAQLPEPTSAAPPVGAIPRSTHLLRGHGADYGPVIGESVVDAVCSKGRI